MMKPKVGVDIDGVVCKCIESVVGIINDKYGTEVAKDDITDWFYKDENFELYAEILAAFETPGFLDCLEPMECARESIERLKYYCDIVFITARHDKYIPQTKAWIERHFGDYTVVHTGPDEDKSAYGIDYLIDDNPDYVKEFTGAGGIAILFDQPWNRGHCMGNKNVWRCKSWVSTHIALRCLFDKRRYQKTDKARKGRGGKGRGLRS